MKCSVALIAIGPLLVVGLYLSLRPFTYRRDCGRRHQAWIAMVAGIGFPPLGAAILLRDFCDPIIALSLLILGPAIALGQSWGRGDEWRI